MQLLFLGHGLHEWDENETSQVDEADESAQSSQLNLAFSSAGAGRDPARVSVCATVVFFDW